jgi:ParB family transcriptional regulator, chromosome partitioning protein
MEVKEIDIDLLYVSELNVRKILVSNDDETGISDLANDIRTNGLINPITVRKTDDKYEIIAGQRRYLAIKLLNLKLISCNIISVDAQKAEEISLVENVQRNQMTYSDKIKTYAKLFDIYNKDIDKVINAINISRYTLQKYLKISSLPSDIISLLDSSQDNKITIDVAIELTKLPNTIDKMTIIDEIKHMTTSQRLSTIKEFLKNKSNNIDDFKEIKENIVLNDNKIIVAPSCPYVIDDNGNCIKIPKELYNDIIESIKEKYNIAELII